MNRVENLEGNQITEYELTEYLMRIQEDTGAVVWAKSYKFLEIPYLLSFNSMEIMNQIILTLSVINTQDFGRGLITKFDENGNVIENFVVLDALTTNINYFFSTSSITITSDNSIIVSAKSTYEGAGLGISISSSLDRILFKIDSQRNINWITAFDFDEQTDSYWDMKKYN